MQKIIKTKLSSESYFGGGHRVIIEVSTHLGESFNLTATYQPGQLYTGFDIHGIPSEVSRPLAIWLARQAWAVDGYLEIVGDQLMLVKPDHSFWYHQPDTKYAIAKIAYLVSLS